MAGVKETKEVLIGANEVAILAVEVLKDGVQLGHDFSVVYDRLTKDQAFKEKLAAAYENISAVPQELGDLDFFEMIDLGKTQLDYVPKFLAAAKKV